MPDVAHFVIPGAKLVDYLLNIDHPGGGSKARFFLARGFARDRPERFAQALTEHAVSERTETAISAAPDGRRETRMVIVGPLGCPDGSEAVVKAVWRVDDGSDTAVFVTAYPGRQTARK